MKKTILVSVILLSIFACSKKKEDPKPVEPTVQVNTPKPTFPAMKAKTGNPISDGFMYAIFKSTDGKRDTYELVLTDLSGKVLNSTIVKLWYVDNVPKSDVMVFGLYSVRPQKPDAYQYTYPALKGAYTPLNY